MALPLTLFGLVCFGSPVAWDVVAHAHDTAAGPNATFDPLVSAPGVSDSPLAGAYNPAAWPISGRGGLYLGWDDFLSPESGTRGLDPRTSLHGRRVFRGALSFGNLGFAMTRSAFEDRDVDHYEYVLGGGFGNRSVASGISYAWTRGAERVFGERDRIILGSVHRNRHFSLGLQRTWDRGPGAHYMQADLGVRPFGPRFTMFADAVRLDGEDLDEIRHGFGAEVNILPGLAAALRFQPRYDPHYAPPRSGPVPAGEGGLGGIGARSPDQWSFRLELSPSPGVRGSVRQHRADGDEVGRTYAVEFRDGPNLRQVMFPPKSYPTIELHGSVVYQNYRFFDDRTRYVALLDRVARYAEDPGVEGVVLRVSGLGLSPAGLWELRAQLAALRDRGKKVVLYFDRMGLPQYVFATVADEIWMDPTGDLDLRGIHLGRTYYKRALERVGIGLDELRFFTYKSAVEALTRTSLSDADREQLGALLADFYDDLVTQVVSSRGIGPDQWQEIVDHHGVVFATEAVELGLVDEIGTFEEAEEAAKDASRRSGPSDAVATLGALHGNFVWSSEEWGEPARIALLYAIGPCEMDSGIRGRALSKAIREAREDDGVRAVVLRVDSPGGDPLPSDLVARELRETAETKPVIISQGQVAASGGYWISMYGDEILVSPYTVTGSIGVILAHMWDDSLGARVGWDYDGMSHGRSADLQRGPAVPFIGSIPHRPMDPEERARAEQLIRQLYGDFVTSVAEGRDMEESAVDAVGQGRIWSGRAGVENGLVDRVGGLWDALALAQERAGLPRQLSVRVEEGPGLGFVRTDGLVPKLIGVLKGGAWGGSAPNLGDAISTGDSSGFSAGGQDGGAPALPGSMLSSRIGLDLWSQLSVADQSHLRLLETHLGRPLVLAPPIFLEGGSGESP